MQIKLKGKLKCLNSKCHKIPIHDDDDDSITISIDIVKNQIND